MSTANPFYVTTPIYYANAELHIGHAFTTLAADTATRFHRAMGEETFFLTGSDEHGQKVEQAARNRGITPQAHVDELVAKFKGLWDKLKITHDDFIRTTEERHKVAVREVLDRLHKKGDIYEARYQGLYCTPCERFWTEKEVTENLCPDCKRPVEQIEEKNYFFKMSKYQKDLIEYINTHPGFIRPESRKNEVLGFLAQPLGDLCISRPKKRLSWGIDLPFDPDYVTYVWFDALTNYITAAGFPTDMARFNKLWPASCHLIGKDILTTHSVYWSTMLMALELPLPECIFAHGWWVSSGGKCPSRSGTSSTRSISSTATASILSVSSCSGKWFSAPMPLFPKRPSSCATTPISPMTSATSCSACCRCSSATARASSTSPRPGSTRRPAR